MYGKKVSTKSATILIISLLTKHQATTLVFDAPVLGKALGRKSLGSWMDKLKSELHKLDIHTKVVEDRNSYLVVSRDTTLPSCASSEVLDALYLKTGKPSDGTESNWKVQCFQQPDNSLVSCTYIEINILPLEEYRFIFHPNTDTLGMLREGFVSPTYHSEKEAKQAMESVALYTLFLHENHIMKDYSNFGFVEEYLDGEWVSLEDPECR